MIRRLATAALIGMAILILAAEIDDYNERRTELAIAHEINWRKK